MIKRLSLASRLALLFAACTAVVSLIAGVLFNRASEAHFIELDQQLLDSKLVALRSALQGVDTPQYMKRNCAPNSTASPTSPCVSPPTANAGMTARRAPSCPKRPACTACKMQAPTSAYTTCHCNPTNRIRHN